MANNLIGKDDVKDLSFLDEKRDGMANNLIGKVNIDNLPYLEAISDEAFIDFVSIVNDKASQMNPTNKEWFGDPSANKGLGNGALYNAFKPAIENKKSRGTGYDYLDESDGFYEEITRSILLNLLNLFGYAPQVHYTDSKGTFLNSNEELVKDLVENGGGERVPVFSTDEHVPRLQIYLGDIVRLLEESNGEQGIVSIDKLIKTGELLYAKLKAIQLIGLFIASYSYSKPFVRLAKGDSIALKDDNFSRGMFGDMSGDISGDMSGGTRGNRQRKRISKRRRSRR